MLKHLLSKIQMSTTQIFQSHRPYRCPSFIVEMFLVMIHYLTNPPQVQMYIFNTVQTFPPTTVLNNVSRLEVFISRKACNRT